MFKKLYAQALLFLALICLGHSSRSQDNPVTIKGTVAGNNGELLSHATVKQAGTNNARMTDSLGRFSITLPAGSILEITYLGYFSKKVKAGSSTVLNITLNENPNVGKLEDAIVIGYGKQKLPTVTGAVGVIDGKDLVQTPVSNITNMLVGRAAGISAVQNSGEPGQNAATIHIRGIATLNGQDPLIVIDGIQQPAEQPYVVLNAMDANEIESISILKDASATAVYGIRGANGVIIITTKRGKSSRPQFGFTANQGFTKASSLFEFAGSYDYAQLRNEAVYNAQAFGDNSFNQLLFSSDDLWKFKNNRDYTPAQVDAMSLTAAQKTALNNSPALYYSSHNYYKEQFSGTGRQQQYNLNVSGGTDRVRYFTSLGYFQQDGILASTTYGGANTEPFYKRYNFRSDFDIDVIKNFQLSINIAGQSAINRVPGANSSPSDFGDRYQNIIQNIMENSPFSGPGIVDGRLITGFLGTSGDPSNPLGAKGGGGYSPIEQALTGGTQTTYTTTLTSNVTLTHNMGYLTKGLNAHFRIAYDDSYTKGYAETISVPAYSAMRDPADPSHLIFVGGILNPTYTADNVGNGSWRKTYLEAAINYARSFGGHNVTALVLGNAQRYTANGMSFNTPSGLMGLVGRTTYNYRERYLVEFNMGVNGTENFAPGRRFGYFPAVSGGWIVSNEPFFPKNKILTWLKLRGSYGQVGNDQLGSRRYLYLPNTWAYNGSGYYFGSGNGSSANPYYSGAQETALGNPDITWERAYKTNYAADLKFIDNKLSVTTTLFRERRNNILVTLQTIPGTYGVSTDNSPPQNVGIVTNNGFELEAGWDDAVGPFRYFIKGNFSYARNKIVYQAEAPYPYPWMDATGYSIGQYKGLLTNGFYNTPEELNNRPYNSYGNNAKLGDLRFRDVNGDGIINEKDMVPIGYSNLPQIAYNLSVGFSYKGFDINALFIGTAKGSFPQYGYILSSPFAKNVGEVLQSAYDGHWTADKYAKGEKISYPEISFNGGGPNNGQLSDFWLKSNDFRRLKNLEVGYSFQRGSALLKTTNIKSIRIYLNGNNLATWGSHLLKGIDPELADNGKNNMGYLYPLTKTFNVGANIQF